MPQPKKTGKPPSQGRSLAQRMRDRTKDLDAEIERQSGGSTASAKKAKASKKK
jgi:hypothetical protein